MQKVASDVKGKNRGGRGSTHLLQELKKNQVHVREEHANRILRRLKKKRRRISYFGRKTKDH